MTPKQTIVRHRMAWPLVIALSVVLSAEVGVRLAKRWLVKPLDWYSCFAQVKADEMRTHRADAKWAETVFVGDSAVMNAFDPAVWQSSCGCDASAYNAGIPGATPRVVELWLRDVVVPYLHPRVVVIGLTSRGFNLKGTDSAYGAYRMAVATRADAGARATRWAGRYSALIRYRSILRDPVHLKPTFMRLVGRTPEEPWDRPSRRGFFPDERKRPYGKGEYRNAANTVFRDYRVSALETSALVRSIAYLRERGIRVALADMPVSEDYPGLHPGGAPTYETYRAALGIIVAEQGVPLLDPRDLHRNDLFVDPIHMNSDGAGEFSRRVTEELAPCSRADGRADDWGRGGAGRSALSSRDEDGS